MKQLINKITMGKPQQMTGPVLWLFCESFFMTAPAVCTYFAIYYLVSAFTAPDKNSLGSLWTVTGVLVVVTVIQFLLSLGAYLYTFLPGARHSAENKKEFIIKLRTLPLGFFLNRKSGELINTFTNDFLAIERSMVGMLTGIFSVVLSCVLTSIFMFLFNPKMALAMYICMPFAALTVFIALRLIGKYTELNIRTKDEAATYLNEYLLGMKSLKSFHMTGTGFKKLEQAYHRLMEVNIKAEAVVGSLFKFTVSLVRIGLPLMCFTGAYLILGGELDIINYLGLIIIGTKIISPIITWIQYLTDIRMHYVSACRIDNVMSKPSLAGDITCRNLGDIRFEHISFSYTKNASGHLHAAKQDDQVLTDVSLTIPPNKLTAIVGPSGGGKTTILRLIARFWDVDSGRILCGDQPIADMDNDSWLSNISMVLQDVYLFHDTIRENILFGRTTATEEEVTAAARRANCHDFIMNLPNGYDTMVGEGGSTLSGGEKQRISIARAILKDAPILLLDEPTASLDAKNEVLIQQAISELIKGRTVIMIAHRLKTIQNSHQILVVDHGGITESGTHRELMAKKGLYHKLYTMQNQSLGWNYRKNA